MSLDSVGREGGIVSIGDKSCENRGGVGGDDDCGIGDKSSVRQGAKVSLCVCVRFKRADVSRHVAKWSTNYTFTTNTNKKSNTNRNSNTNTNTNSKQVCTNTNSNAKTNTSRNTNLKRQMSAASLLNGATAPT